MSNYLGLDWGEKRIGMAIANSENAIATPFKTVQNISSVIDIIKKEDIEKIVIGLPKKMSSARIENFNFEKFVKILKEKTRDMNLLFFFIDERLSSVQADSLKNIKIKQDRDCVSAMIILQSYLDKKNAKK